MDLIYEIENKSDLYSFIFQEKSIQSEKINMWLFHIIFVLELVCGIVIAKYTTIDDNYLPNALNSFIDIFALICASILLILSKMRERGEWELESYKFHEYSLQYGQIKDDISVMKGSQSGIDLLVDDIKIIDINKRNKLILMVRSKFDVLENLRPMLTAAEETSYNDQFIKYKSIFQNTDIKKSQKKRKSCINDPPALLVHDSRSINIEDTSIEDMYLRYELDRLKSHSDNLSNK